VVRNFLPFIPDQLRLLANVSYHVSVSTDSLQVRADRARNRLGQVLGEKWRLDSILGVGGMATVYAATHRNGKRAALKLLHPELSATDDLVQRFLREGRVANKMAHPGAVSILDDDKLPDGSVYLVMELLEGYSLDKHTKRGAERLSIEQVLKIGDEVLDVLAVAHELGVIHRDIKPANIFLEKTGAARVLDFGIARLIDPTATANSGLTQTGTAIGTPAFMPPEQARGRWNLVDRRTDLWAVGATLHALLTGEKPRAAETMQEELLAAMTAPIAKLADRAPQVPLHIAQVIDKACSFEQDDRYPDARAMQAAIREAVARGVKEVPPDQQSTPGAPHRPNKSNSEDMTTGSPLTATSRTVKVRRSRALAIVLASFVGALVIGLGARHLLTSDHGSAVASGESTTSPADTSSPGGPSPVAPSTHQGMGAPPPPSQAMGAGKDPEVKVALAPVIPSAAPAVDAGVVATLPPRPAPFRAAVKAKGSPGATQAGVAAEGTPTSKTPADPFGDRF
jgi:serine/threonine-protein kinase